ncbi:MAG TPA: galactokinase [Bryobacteraceae bacterium]|nr:galactokinase [Bryobacteraceae bacterium]
MIITRSPLRISLGGGGTDLPSYYLEHGGFAISAAIDRYVYITLHNTFQPGLIVKYSKMEHVDGVSDLKHPIVREALRLVLGEGASYLEMTSMSDIPAGTGLGSSGSFTTALLTALHTLNKTVVGRQDLAEQACHIEIDRLGEPVGKQDQYIAAFGGLQCLHFGTDGSVNVEPLAASAETLYTLEDNLVLFFTGYTRSASAILQEQDTKSRQKDTGMAQNLHFIKELGMESKRAFEAGDPRRFGEIMHVHWEHKKKRSSGMSNPRIDEWYEAGRAHGAIGGKLIGAGGGGFLMFYTEDKTRLRHAMKRLGLSEVRIRFDFEGSAVVARS